MAICRIVDTGVSPEEYEKVRKQLGAGDTPPEGSSLHLAGTDDDGKIRIVEVWESRDEAEAFGEKVRVAREEAGVGADGPPQITYLEVYNLVKG